jgi:hypothetical protein
MNKCAAIVAAAAMLASPLVAQPSRLTPAQESAYARALGECMTNKSTGDDRATFAQWFAVVINSSSKVRGVATVAPGKKDELDRKVAALFTRLMTIDCRDEAKPLWRARSQAGFRTAGEVLGRLAIQEVMSGEDADRMFGGYLSYIVEADFARLDD